MILTHLPILQVIVPLIAAPICVLVRRPAPARVLAIAASWIALAIACLLLAQVYGPQEPLSYLLGGWAAPWGIEYRVDVLNALVLVTIAGIGAVVVLFAPAGLAREIPAGRQNLFYCLYLLCLTGMLGVTITGDAFNLFVFLEIASLSSYVLIGIGPNRRALKAAYRYLVMGTVGASFILIGVGLLYMMTGTLNMADMSVQLDQAKDTRTVLVAFAFLTVGISLKLALFPLHQWLPDSYTHAPAAVAAFLAGTATKVAFYVLLRFFFTIFGPAFLHELRLDVFLVPLALTAIFVGALVAIFQDDIRRMLAYSTVSQIGYMVLGLGLAISPEAPPESSVYGLTGGIVHLFNHALTKTGLFLVLGCLAFRLGSVRLHDLRGAGRRMPVTMFAFVLGGLSLIGAPLTAGFISKWYLVLGALERGWWPVAGLILLSSLLAVVYVWRVVEVAYFQEPPEGKSRVTEAPLAMLVPMGILIAATLVFGTWAGLTAGVAKQAARMLLGVAP